MVFGAWAIWRQQTIDEAAADLPQKISSKLDKLWDIAQESLRDRKYLRAEKALLTILRVDKTLPRITASVFYTPNSRHIVMQLSVLKLLKALSRARAAYTTSD